MTDFFTEDDCDGITVHQDKGKQQVFHYPSISLLKANRLLRERGQVVYGDEDSDKHGWVPESCIQEFGATVKGLIINIEPIEQDSAEKVLEDLIGAYQKRNRNDPMGLPELIDRAKALLRKGSGERC